MKKIFITLIFCIFAVSISAMTFKTTKFSYRENNGYGWSAWSAAEDSDMKVELDQNTLVIYSPIVQWYSIFNIQPCYIDEDGDKVIEANFYDQDMDKGTLNIIYRTASSTYQIYIRFSNIQWVYDVVVIGQ